MPLLFADLGTHLEFRRCEVHWPRLSTVLPDSLRGETPRDMHLSAHDQAVKIVRSSGWMGPDPIDVKSEAGRAIKARRPWYNEE